MRLDVRHERLWVGLCDYIHVCVCDKTHPVVTSCGCEQQVLTHSDGGSYLKRESAVWRKRIHRINTLQRGLRKEKYINNCKYQLGVHSAGCQSRAREVTHIFLSYNYSFNLGSAQVIHKLRAQSNVAVKERQVG